MWLVDQRHQLSKWSSNNHQGKCCLQWYLITIVHSLVWLKIKTNKNLTSKQNFNKLNLLFWRKGIKWHRIQVNLQYVTVLNLDKSNQRHQTCTFILQGKNFHFPPQDHNLKMSLNHQWYFWFSSCSILSSLLCLITVKPYFTDTSLILTSLYFRQFAVSIGKESLSFSLNSTCLYLIQTPRWYGYFLWPIQCPYYWDWLYFAPTPTKLLLVYIWCNK